MKIAAGTAHPMWVNTVTRKHSESQTVRNYEITDAGEGDNESYFLFS